MSRGRYDGEPAHGWNLRPRFQSVAPRACRYFTVFTRADRNRGIVAGAENSARTSGGQTARCGDGRYARQHIYSVRSLIQNPLERARTEVKLAPGFLVRSAPKPRRVVHRVGA